MTDIDDLVDTVCADLAPITLSPRDIQWIAAVFGVAATLLRNDDDIIDHNIHMMERVMCEHYSAAEFNALNKRVRALLPADSPIEFLDGFRVASQTTLVQ